MGEFRNNDCCEPKECCCQPQQCCHDNFNNCSNDNSIWMIILIVIVLCVFCGGDNKGGLFGGLF